LQAVAIGAAPGVHAVAPVAIATIPVALAAAAAN